MKITKTSQYNQGIGKNKILSSTAGVGSIVTTKTGTYILISDIEQWEFIASANKRVASYRQEEANEQKIYEYVKKELCRRGLNVVDDPRFIRFLRKEKELKQLACLIEIPHMTLSESFNTPNWINHPIRNALERIGENTKGAASQYMVKGTHFPKWFRNKKGELKKLREWYALWNKECAKYPIEMKLEHYAPPRDASDYVGIRSERNEEGYPVKVREYRELDQTHLILICPNGHLSDIPWPNYLRWKTDKALHKEDFSEEGKDLLTAGAEGQCCSNPQLKWTESKTKSEGYASVFIECMSCGLGNGKDSEHPKINLEGINGLEPYCIGEKPWEMSLENGSHAIPTEPCYVRGEATNGQERMKVVLVTSNNVYYANMFASIFIPDHLSRQLSTQQLKAHEILEKIYNTRLKRQPSLTKEEYWGTIFLYEDFLLDNGFDPEDKELFKKGLYSLFMGLEDENASQDTYVEYRWQEYNCFVTHPSIPVLPENKGLRFHDITLPEELSPYFTKIQQIEDLRVTNIQLDFTRVRPKERVFVDGEVREASIGKNIFSVEKESAFVLPATEARGEGLFFQFSDQQLMRWMSQYEEMLSRRFYKYLKEPPKANEQGKGTKWRIYHNGVKHFLIHSFSHMMMRELEFSCGYPTASLKERLYISNPERTNSDSTGRLMSGVLIYTAEGSEGSMGGLVSQGEPEKISEIIRKGLERAVNCSSDPLCWGSEGQGIFDLNLAACFSCSLVSETACEEMNLGLDRRILVDEEFGFLKELI